MRSGDPQLEGYAQLLFDFRMRISGFFNLIRLCLKASEPDGALERFENARINLPKALYTHRHRVAECLAAKQADPSQDPESADT